MVDYVIYMFDFEGCVYMWNLGVEWIKGYIVDEIIGYYFLVFYIELDCVVGELVCGFVYVCKYGCFENKVWCVCKDGLLFWVYVVIDWIDDDEGCFIGFVKIMCDVIEVRCVEEVLEEMCLVLY